MTHCMGSAHHTIDPRVTKKYTTDVAIINSANTLLYPTLKRNPESSIVYATSLVVNFP